METLPLSSTMMASCTSCASGLSGMRLSLSVFCGCVSLSPSRALGYHDSASRGRKLLYLPIERVLNPSVLSAVCRLQAWFRPHNPGITAAEALCAPFFEACLHKGEDAV